MTTRIFRQGNENKMDVTIILPAIGKKKNQKYIGSWKMEPLTVAVLKSVMPSYVNLTFYDDRLELIDYDRKTELVFITVETYTARRTYKIAARYREMGIPVVMGGYHVTLLPEEASLYADAIITGNAEGIIASLLDDFRNGRMQKRYTGTTMYSSKLPDHSIFTGKKYLPVSLVETGRGCCHSCEFCAISSYYGCRYHRRPIEDIIKDIELHRHKYYFMVDDNLFADRKHLYDLLPRIKECNIKWASQGTLSLASDPELLRMMKDSGCEIILVGFESLNEANLLQMNKKVNISKSDRDTLVQRIHDAGIGIYATFVFGYDEDDENTVAEALRFSEKHRFYTAAFNHLLPFPGTELYNRLKTDGRLLYDNWWLQENYNYGELSFNPKKISAEKLSLACLNARRDFSGAGNVFARGFQAMGHASPAIWSLFWAMNLKIGGEVDMKMNIPIGENLDELPK